MVSWGAYAAGVTVLHWSVAVSNTVSWIAAVAFAYVANKIWVFRSYRCDLLFVLQEAALFVGARIPTGLFEIAAVPLL